MSEPVPDSETVQPDPTDDVPRAPDDPQDDPVTDGPLNSA